MAYRVLIPQPGIRPGPKTVKAPSLNHWTAKEFPNFVSFEHNYISLWISTNIYKKIYDKQLPNRKDFLN